MHMALFVSRRDDVGDGSGRFQEFIGHVRGAVMTTLHDVDTETSARLGDHGLDLFDRRCRVPVVAIVAHEEVLGRLVEVAAKEDRDVAVGQTK